MTVVVATDVFAARLHPGSVLASLYDRHPVGQRLVLAPQTVAETLYGALKPGWGRRWLDRVHALIRRAHTLQVDIETIERVARLRNDCRSIGNALHQKRHNGDLWVAATAIGWGVPLVAHDRCSELSRASISGPRSRRRKASRRES